MKHFGHIVELRIEGENANMKQWNAISTGDLAIVYNRLESVSQQQRQTIIQEIAYDRLYTLICIHGTT